MEMRPGIHSVGVLNPNLRVFDIIMRTEYGTSYNAFLIRDEKTALVETVHGRYTDVFLENVEAVCPVEDIDYVILNHTEPDHSGSLVALLERNPRLQVVASPAALKNLASITNRSFPAISVKDGDSLCLGKRVLRFVIAPNLHWPDSMFTIIEAEKLAFTCDFLGAHYCEPYVLDSRISFPKCYEDAFLSYYKAIFSPFKRFVLSGLDKLERFDIEMALPSHGPVLTEQYALAKQRYRTWSSPRPHTVPTAVIAYVSAYGYTRKLATLAAEFLEKAGYRVVVHSPGEDSLDMEEIYGADLLLIGSPTINRDALKPIWDLVSSLDAVNITGKPCAVFGSYGWSGEAVPMLKNRLNDLKLKVYGEGYRVPFNPNEAALSGFRDYLSSWLASLSK